MTTYSDFQKFLLSYNFTGNAPGTIDAFGNLLPTTDADGRYIVTYSILDNQSDVANISYYGVDTPEFDAFVGGGDYKPNIQNSLLNLYADYTVNRAATLFSDVAKIKFENTDQDNSDGNDTFDSGDTAGMITIGQVTGSYPVWGGNNGLAAVVDTNYVSGNPSPQSRFSDIWFNADAQGGYWDDPITLGSQQYKVLLEETIHTLGIDLYRAENLIDPSKPYDPSTNPLKAEYESLNSQKYTVTSYNNAPGMSADFVTGNDAVAPWTLQLMDIAALQSIYGRNYDKLAGDTTYTIDFMNPNANKATPFLYTIWDGGGADTINMSSHDGRVQIDLRQGHFSSIGKDTSGFGVAWDENMQFPAEPDPGNVAIAFHTVIENATGTDQNDILIGNAWGNRLEGGEGSDKIYGDGIVYDGNSGFTDIDPNDSDDPNQMRPLSDDDILIGGKGDDFLYGGAGGDTADYSADFAQGGTGGIIVDLDVNGNGRTMDGFGNSDNLYLIENIVGTSKNDQINLSVPAGRVIDGAGGVDAVTYSLASALIYDEATGRVWDPRTAQYDLLKNIENVNVAGAPEAAGPERLDFSASSGSALTTVIVNDDFWQRPPQQFWIFLDRGKSTAILSVEATVKTVEGQNDYFIHDDLSLPWPYTKTDVIGAIRNSVQPIEITGTNHGDRFEVDHNPYTAYTFPTPVTFNTGSGDDTIILGPNSVKGLFTTVTYRGGNV